MNLPFLNSSRRLKLKNTFLAVRLVYEMEPRTAVLEAFFFISDAFLQMYKIALFGQFLDETISYVRSVERFYLPEYLRSGSFFLFLKLAGLWLVVNIFASFKNYLNNRLEIKFLETMPSKIIAKIASLNMEDIESVEFQNLLSKVNTYATSRILDSYWRVRQVVYHLVKILSAAFFVLRINVLLPLGAFLLVLPEILYKYHTKKSERRFLDKKVDKRKYVDYVYSESTSLRNFPELKVDGIFKFFLETRDAVIQELVEGVSRQRFARYIKGFMFALFDQLLFRILLIGLITLAVLQKFTAGTFQALFRYMINLYGASLALWDRLSIIGDNAQYINDYFAFASFAGFGDVSTGDRRLRSGTPRIRVVDLTFEYQGRGAPVVRNLNFEIRPGEKVALVGGDGSGKTTIVKLLCGLYRISKGDILYDEFSIKNLRRGELKEKISVLFENFVRYNLSIRENILVSATGRGYDPNLYRRVLRVTLLDDWLKREGLPDSQILGRLFAKGMDISSGHWQRIALARTLYRDRPVFILDEPLVFVDGPTRRTILRNVLEFVGDRTLIVTLHSMEDIKFFERVLLVEEGSVREVELGSDSLEDLTTSL